MKKYLAILLVIVISLGVFAQSKSTDKAELKAHIEKQAEIIKRDLNSYSKSEMSADSAGYRWHYFKGNELKLVHVKYTRNETEMNVDWYFNNGELIYSESIWTNTQSGKLVQNVKAYLNNGQLFEGESSLIGKIEPGSKEFKEMEDGLKDYAKKLKEEKPK
jgi:hypothetical protein